MRRLKLVAVLILLVVAGLAAYAYLGDMDPARKEVRQPLPMPGAAVQDVTDGDDGNTGD